jgi:hypothetical protein
VIIAQKLPIASSQSTIHEQHGGCICGDNCCREWQKILVKNNHPIQGFCVTHIDNPFLIWRECSKREVDLGRDFSSLWFIVVLDNLIHP